MTAAAWGVIGAWVLLVLVVALAWWAQRRRAFRFGARVAAPPCCPAAGFDHHDHECPRAGRGRVP